MASFFDPYIAAERAREAYRKTIAQFEPVAPDAPVPESVSSLAEKIDTETRDSYKRSKNVFDDGLDSVEGVGQPIADQATKGRSGP